MSRITKTVFALAAMQAATSAVNLQQLENHQNVLAQANAQATANASASNIFDSIAQGFNDLGDDIVDAADTVADGVT